MGAPLSRLLPGFPVLTEGEDQIGAGLGEERDPVLVALDGQNLRAALLGGLEARVELGTAIGRWLVEGKRR